VISLRFLVIGKDIDYGGPVDPREVKMVLEQLYKPSFEMLKKWEMNEKGVGGVFAAQRGGAIILEAESAEELSPKIKSLPFWARESWEIIPLQTFQSAIEDLDRQIEQVKKMAAMPPKPK